MRSSIPRILITVLIIATIAVAFACAMALWSPGKCNAEEARKAGPADLVLGELARAVQNLQPWYRSRPERAAGLAEAILHAAQAHEQDPFLALAVAFAESALHPSVGEGRRLGSKGERGYFQVMPDSRPERLCGRGQDMFDASENAATAMCYFAHLEELCQTRDPWVLVAAYALARCPSPRYARRMRMTRKRRAILCRVVGEPRCLEIWPI